MHRTGVDVWREYRINDSGLQQMFTFLSGCWRTESLNSERRSDPIGGESRKKPLIGPLDTTATERLFGARRRAGNLFPVGITDEKQFRCNGFRRNYNPAVMVGTSSVR